MPSIIFLLQLVFMSTSATVRTSTMRNLLVLLDADFIGGAETNYKYILPRLKERGWNVIFVSSGDTNIHEYFAQYGLTVSVLPLFRKYFSLSENGKVSFANIFRTWRAMRKNRSILKKLIREYQPPAIVSN